MPKSLKRFLLVSLSIGFFSLFWLISPQFARAFSVIGDPVTYDVTFNSFCVAWEAKIDGTISTVEAIVYNDQAGTSRNTNSSCESKVNINNGVMAVQVTGLAAQQTYYYQIKVVENGVEYYYPPAAPFKEVVTQFDEGAQGNTPPPNPSITFRVYQADGVTPATGAFVYMEVAGASYPVAGDWNSGWVDDYGDGTVSLGGGTLFSQSSKKYLTLNGGESITVKCLGGSYGSKAATIASFDLSSLCQSGFECVDEYANQIVLAVNSPPRIDSIAKASGSDIREVNGKYVIKPGQQFALEIVGSDPDEGENIISWALKNTPDSNMTITKDAANPNKAKIIWSPVGTTLKEYTVTIEASNDKTGSKTFTVLVTDGKPSPPTSVVITPASPKTSDNLVCTAQGGADPLGDPVTYTYTWYKNGAVQSDLTGNTVPSSRTAKGESWSCSVTVKDTPFDGESAAVASNTVTIANTPATGTPSVSIGPANPTTSSDLTATVSISGCSDADGDSLGYTLKWFKNGQETSNTGLTLPASQTQKGETWVCKATLTEGGVSTANVGTSNSLTIGNTAPSAPGSISIEKVANGLKCTVGQPATDADSGDTIKYIYKWVCTVGGVVQPAVIQGPTTELSQVLSSGLAKNQTWYCEVAVTDGTATTDYVRNPAAQNITIVNNPPTKPVASITPASPYKDSILVCTITTPSSDPDGDAVRYTYEWFKDGQPISGSSTSNTSSTSATLPSGIVLVQGAQYTCKVTPSDGQTDGPAHLTAAVTIGNRTPTMTIKKGGQIVDTVVSVNEAEPLTLEIIGSDADNNRLVCSALSLPEGATFANNILSWTPAVGASAINQGIYQASFKIQETDGQPTNLSVTKNIQIQVIYPSKVVEDFEYPASQPKPSDNGWISLQGQGQMMVMEEAEGEQVNHYLKTITSYTDPNNTSATGQLQYIITKWLNNPLDTQGFPELQFTIADRNLYYFEVCVHAIDNSGQGKNYFLRYIPQDPVNNKEFEVRGLYINWYIGKRYINPAGCQIKRSMESDLNKAIAATQDGYQVHYDYLMGIILRGDIDSIDDIAVAKGTLDLKPPRDVENLTAIAKDKAVILSWTIPADQDSDTIGYLIETVGTKVDKVPATATMCTVTGLINGKNYTFTVKAFDNAPVRDNSGKIIGNVSNGVSISMQPQKDTTAPVWPANALSATPQNKAVLLSWVRPSDADLDFFEIFQDGSSIKVVDKTVTSYRITNLENDRQYTFTVKAYDNASPPNASSVSVMVKPSTPVEISVDDFDYPGVDKPTDHGWFRLQGTGSINRVVEGTRSYMNLTTSASAKLNFIVVKWMDNPEEYNNPELHFDLRSSGNCRVEFCILASNGNKYFMSYQPDITREYDYCNPPDKIQQGLYITHYLGWKMQDANEWRSIVRNLNRDLQDAKGLENVTFKYLLGIIFRGEGDIDNIRLEKAIPDVDNLIARPGNGSVGLSWSSADPSAVKEFLLSIDGGEAIVIPNNPIVGTANEYSYQVGGLTNDLPYTFRIIQVMKDELESNGVEVSAVPRQFTHIDDCSMLSNWYDNAAGLGDISMVYDPEVHSQVISIVPEADAAFPARYLAATNLNATGKSVTLRIKAKSEFMLWFKVRDSYSVEYNFLYATGGTAQSGASIGTWAYSYLGPSYTDGKWHILTLNLEDLLQAYYGYIDLSSIDSVAIGGNVLIDDLSVY
ncbi:MAG: fibronectin type III domain-containing protein [bacterium]|nr:fibronectin type III domain-containing protein [bacterium]